MPNRAAQIAYPSFQVPAARSPAPKPNEHPVPAAAVYVPYVRAVLGYQREQVSAVNVHGQTYDVWSLVDRNRTGLASPPPTIVHTRVPVDPLNPPA